MAGHVPAIVHLPRGYPDDVSGVANEDRMIRHCEEAKPTKQSRLPVSAVSALLRCARNDEEHIGIVRSRAAAHCGRIFTAFGSKRTKRGDCYLMPG